MLNPDAEINRFRSSLMAKGIDYEQIDMVVDAVSTDINEAILDVVASAMEDTAIYAADLGAEEFIEEMDLQEIGGSFQIVTISGKTDYSTPKTQMLPHLIKNGEIAEDGSKYKVIPMREGKKESGTIGKSIFESQQALQKSIQMARESLRNGLRQGQSPRATEMTQRFREIARQRVAARKSFYSLPKLSTGGTSTSPEPTPEFRTASSKQDPNTQWVIPARDLDMTGFLMDINKRIQDEIYHSVNTIISEYERIF